MPLRILLVTGNYLPSKNGGIENYTHWLALNLLQNGFIVEVASLNYAGSGDYIYEGIKVHNLKEGFLSFVSLLENGAFDICHFHEYSEYGGIELPWFKKAKENSKKVFFTFHLPYLTCYKGDFRYKGIEDCQTFSNPLRCTECVIADKSGYKNLGKSDFIIHLVTGLLGITGAKKKLTEKIKTKHYILNDLISTCDEVFVIANWFKNILFENGYNSPVIKKIPNKGKPEIAPSSIAQNRIRKNKLIFIGRIQRQKGLHLLCTAMKRLTKMEVEVDVYGNLLDQVYFANCAKDYAFNFKGTVSREELLEKLKDYDFLVLPSVFTEMYPMVIMDAFHRELPVIASTAKGNKDIVIDGINGFLFNYDDAKDLAITIDKAYSLKKEGWNPSFSNSGNAQKDIREVMSYYCGNY